MQYNYMNFSGVSYYDDGVDVCRNLTICLYIFFSIVLTLLTKKFNITQTMLKCSDMVPVGLNKIVCTKTFYDQIGQPFRI